MEELLKKGASIVVLDPHADYALMKTGEPARKYSQDIRIFRTPLSSSRFLGETGSLTSQFTIRFQDLDADEISDIMGLKEEWSTMRKIVSDMVKFRTDEVERIYMATFERIIGIPFYETRGERSR